VQVFGQKKSLIPEGMRLKRGIYILSHPSADGLYDLCKFLVKKKASFQKE
jgi:hypothetical protein